MSQAQETISYTHRHTHTNKAPIHFFQSYLHTPDNILWTELTTEIGIGAQARRNIYLKIWMCHSDQRSAADASLCGNRIPSSLSHLVPVHIQVFTSAMWLRLKKRKTGNSLSWRQEYLTSDKMPKADCGSLCSHQWVWFRGHFDFHISN